MSDVSRSDGRWRRPAWCYTRTPSEFPGHESALLEMLESVRNAVEQVRDELRGIRACNSIAGALRDVRQIRRNTAKRKYVRKVTV